VQTVGDSHLQEDHVDTAGPGPTVRRRQLGRQLRQLRIDAGKKPEEVAKYIGVQRPTVTRIEQGKVTILPRNVRLMCQFYEVGAPLLDTLLRLTEEANERGWWVSYSDTMPDWFADYVGLEADAAKIHGYENEFVPGLLQTPNYIRAVTAAAHPYKSDADLEQSVRFRTARQDRLAVARPPHLHFVVNEAALLRPVGGPEVMAEQIDHLEQMAGRPFVTLQILSIGVGAHAAMTGPFTMLQFPDDLGMNTVYLEHERGAGYLERPSDLERYSYIFESLCQSALTPENSATRLVSLKAGFIRATREGGTG
jgi:transcriptional regulator with XRE-family HTH domain